MSLNIPNVFVGGPGNKAYANKVNENFTAIANKFTEGPGGIADSDISATAAIRGTKISNIPGNRLPGDRIEDDAIGATQLKDDVTAGSPNAAVQTAAHIKDAIITAAKLVAGTVAKDRMKVTEVTQVITNLGLPVGAIATIAAVGVPALSTIVPLSLTFDSISSNGGAPVVVEPGYGNGGTGVTWFTFAHNQTVAGFTVSGTVRFRYLAFT